MDRFSPSSTLPLGDYRFRADYDGGQYWSGESNHCTIPGCVNVEITADGSQASAADGLPFVFNTPHLGKQASASPLPARQAQGTLIAITVLDTDGLPAQGLPVYAFDESTYTGYHGTTDASGQVNLTLPQGDYRFRSDLNGTQFWSGGTNHCNIPGCTETGVTVTTPVTVTVLDTDGQPVEGLPVYTFDGTTYTGFHATTDANGEVVLTLPDGSYRFRADYDGVQFWSGETDDCAVPGCLTSTVELPGGGGAEPISRTIDYTYDPLYRLTAADYSTGEYYHYVYDAVGNRLSEQTDQTTNIYNYDAANRLTTVNGVAYSWSNNGNLLSDGFTSYSYDHANRLTGVEQEGDVYGYAYNGLGDRLVQTVNNAPTTYTLDLNRGLTQVLGDGSNAYLYGVNRIGELQSGGWAYHLPDALGSLRQIADGAVEVQLAQSFEPFGIAQIQGGTSSSSFGFTGEWLDDTGLIHLRARYYAPSIGNFISPDLWMGDDYHPMSHNPWLFVYANPVNNVDPSGWCAEGNEDCINLAYTLETRYGFRIHWPSRQDDGKSGPYPYGYWRRWLKLDCGEDNRGFTHFMTRDLENIQESLEIMEQALGNLLTYRLTSNGVLFKTNLLDTATSDLQGIYCPRGECRVSAIDALDFAGVGYSIGFDTDWSASREVSMYWTVIHEYGHEAHYMINALHHTRIEESLTTTWSIHGSPTNYAVSGHGVDEYFAETFTMFIWETTGRSIGHIRAGATSLHTITRQVYPREIETLYDYFANEIIPLLKSIYGTGR